MKLILKIAAGIILAIILVAVGCSALVASSVDDETQDAIKALDTQTGVVRVSAPDEGCWSGSIGDSTKDGCGSKTFTIEDEAIIAAVVQKQGEGDWTLSVEIEVDGEIVDSGETSAQFGVVTVGEG